jgi:hypothetical protein
MDILDAVQCSSRMIVVIEQVWRCSVDLLSARASTMTRIYSSVHGDPDNWRFSFEEAF